MPARLLTFIHFAVHLGGYGTIQSTDNTTASFIRHVVPTMKRNVFCVIYATFPDLSTARRIIKGLLTNKLIACGNIFRLSSLYVWKGAIEDSAEYGALLKTKKAKYKEVENYIKKRHPYEVPEIISWTLERGLKQYLHWLNKET